MNVGKPMLTGSRLLGGAKPEAALVPVGTALLEAARLGVSFAVGVDGACFGSGAYYARPERDAEGR